MSFSLIRKPFKDNLFYLEWLLAEPDQFMDLYMSGQVKQLDSASPRWDRSTRVAIISKALEKSSMPFFSEGDSLYDLRYNKEAHFGLEPIWNKATHLITTQRHYTTEGQNLNFVFANQESKIEQWHTFYGTAPLLLLHFLGVAEALAATIGEVDMKALASSQVKRAAGLILHSEATNVDGVPQAITVFKMVLAEHGLGNCAKCGASHQIGAQQAIEVFYEGQIKCSSCRTINRL